MTIEVYHRTQWRVNGHPYFTVSAYSTEDKGLRVYHSSFNAEALSLRNARSLARSMKCPVYYVKDKKRQYPLGVD